MAGWKLRKDKTQTETVADSVSGSGETATLPPQTLSPVDPLTGEMRRWEVSGATEATDEEIQKEISSLLKNRSEPEFIAPVEDEPIAAAEIVQHEEVQHEEVRHEDNGHYGEPINLGSDYLTLPSNHLPEFTAPVEDEPVFAAEPTLDEPLHEEPPHFAAPIELGKTSSGHDFSPDEEAEDDGPEPLFDDSPASPEPDFIAAAPPLAMPLPSEPAMPLFQTPSPPAAEEEPETDQFIATLRLDRAELSSSYLPPTPTGFTVPPVAPFLLDVPADEGPAMPHTLVVRIGRLSATFEMTKDVTIIGRPDSSLHYYPDIEIEMDDAVSRRHAEILKRDDAYYIADAGSTNGTLLNGEMLPAHEERLLVHGDRIRVGERTEIIFE